MHEIDQAARIALHVLLALGVGILLGEAWEAWRDRRYRRTEAERVALDTLRRLYHR